MLLLVVSWCHQQWHDDIAYLGAESFMVVGGIAKVREKTVMQNKLVTVTE